MIWVKLFLFVSQAKRTHLYGSGDKDKSQSETSPDWKGKALPTPLCLQTFSDYDLHPIL